MERSLLTDGKLRALASAFVASKWSPSTIVAEMGVYQGGTAKFLAGFALSKIHLFDTFAGIPEDDANGQHKRGEFAEALCEVRKFLGDDDFVYHAGLLPETIPPDFRFCFIHMDLDTEQSTGATLDVVMHQMIPGGCIVMDDWHWHACPGVTAAVEKRFTPDRLVEISPNQVKILF